MFKSLLRGAFPLLLASTATGVLAQPDPPVTAPELMRHIERLASDEYQGRAPGTEGERLTINYIAEQFAARGVEPAGEGGSWFQPVRLVDRGFGSMTSRWMARGNAVSIADGEIMLMGREASESVADAPVVFAGHGARMPERGIDQLAGAEIRGAIAFIVLTPPEGVDGFPPVGERIQALADAGAAAVIVIVPAEMPWEMLRAGMSQATTRLDETPVPRLVGAMPQAAVERLVSAAGMDLGRLLNDQPGSSFRSVALPIRASMEVATQVNRYTSNNVVGRIRGSGTTGENLLFLGHWDHLGLCRPEGAPDRICNGAVDNASGIATLIEVAGRLSRPPRPVRDILFLATTAEESGLLGARYFAAHPVVPAESIVAAINMDTVAIHPAGEPVAVMGRGIPALDAAIDATVTAMGRRLDTDNEAEALVRRQDGYALVQAGIPAIMVGGSFSNMAPLNAFLSGPYHKPEDQLGPNIQLGGAAEDATLLVALGRRLADPSAYARPERPAR
jgi:hypothetical protein